MRFEPLAHPNRAALMDCIRNHPGLTFRGLLRCSGVAAGTARHHLTILFRHKLVEEHRHRATLRFFVRGSPEAQQWRTTVMLREAPLRLLHAWIAANPSQIQRAILDHAERQWQWRRSTTQHRLWRLVDDGLVAVREQGRRKCYTVLEAGAPIPLLRRLEEHVAAA